MSATEPLTKVDSAVQGLSSSPKDTKAPEGKRRASSGVPGVYNINDLGMSSSAVHHRIDRSASINVNFN
jgi:hypothetical protein